MPEQARDIAGHHYHILRVLCRRFQTQLSDVFHSVMMDLQGNVGCRDVHAQAPIPREGLIVDDTRTLR